MQTILVIAGPTAVGKTELSIELARMLDAEIISADSMQVYRGLDIGTAKPSLAERGGIPHHMIDVVEPDREFSVAEYQARVERTLGQLAARGKVPILTGGTGLYIQAVLDGFVLGAKGKDADLRQELREIARKEGGHVLYARLQAVDPATASRLHPHDLRRVIRALEVHGTTGVPLSAHLAGQDLRPPRHDSLRFGLRRERSQLYRRIDLRVDQMIARGLIEEVRELLHGDLGNDSTAMQALGYKEIAGYLQGAYDLEAAVRLLKRNTRRYAKRQLTWFRRDPAIRWLDVDTMSSTAAATQIATEYRRRQ